MHDDHGGYGQSGSGHGADDHHHGHGERSQETHPLWKMDRIELKSVGIDVGSSTSHLVFSALEMRRQSAVLSSRFELTRRTILHESDILLTPFLDASSIDADGLSNFFRGAYAKAGLSPRDIDTGAVITTGDAARKDNAAAIVQLLSEEMGHFVCASAGPLLEAKMAAYGSGSVARSVGTGRTILNIDVGGGTAKIAIARAGKVVDAAAINVGARLVTFDNAGLITKMERTAEIVSRHLGLALRVGARLDPSDARRMAAALVECLLETAARQPLSPLTAELMISAPLSYVGDVHVVLFSGGVAEYLQAGDRRAYGDIGPELARGIETLLPVYLPAVRHEAASQRIRATVIGASQFTAQVSGNTIFVGDPRLLPVRNLPVLCVDLSAASGRELTAEIEAALARSEIVEGETSFAIALRGHILPSYDRLRATCEGVADALRSTISRRRPIFLVVDSDIARLLGRTLSDLLGGYRDIVCIDGVELQDFDYVDIGEERQESHVVSVVIKSLVFNG